MLPHCSRALSKVGPTSLAILPDDSRAIFIDEEKVVWRKGYAVATRNLLRSIAIATTMFEFVVVMNVTAQACQL